MKCSEHPRTSRKVGKLKNTERELWNQTLLSLCNTMVGPGAGIPKGILWVILISNIHKYNLLFCFWKTNFVEVIIILYFNPSPLP